MVEHSGTSETVLYVPGYASLLSFHSQNKLTIPLYNINTEHLYGR